MRWMAAALAMALAGNAYPALAGDSHAVATEYSQGEFRFSVGPVPEFVQPHALPAQWDPAAPGADEARWRFWLNEEQVDQRKGRRVEYTDYVYEPRALSVLGEAGRHQISFNPSYQSLVIHEVQVRRNGVWANRLDPARVSLARRESEFENDMADGLVTALIVLDDVQIGDVVRVRYSISGSNPVLAGQLIDSLSLGWTSPVLDARLRVLYDPGTDVATQSERGAPAAVVSARDDATEVVARSHALGAVVDEEAYPLGYRPFPVVRVSARRHWRDVVKWALPLYPAVQELPADLEQRVQAWAAEADPYRRATLALRAVQDEVRYFGVEMGDNTHRPNPPALTWSRRYGDCKDKAYLLSTLLRRLGVEAVPALVSATRGKALQDWPAAAADFDHVIVRARIGGAPLWMDPTLSAQGGNVRDTSVGYLGVGLPIAEGSDRLEPIPDPMQADAGITAREHYAPAADGRIAFEVQTQYRGHSANYARGSLLAQRREELAQRYAEFYRKRFGEVTRVGAPVVSDDRERNLVTIAERYELPAAAYERSGAQRWLDVNADALNEVATLPAVLDRKGPLAFAAPARYRHEVQVDVPAQWRTLTTAADTRVSSPAFEYRRQVQPAPGSVKVSYELDVRQREIAAAQSAAHLARLREARDTLSTRVSFESAASQDAREREARLKALLGGSEGDAR